LAPDGFGAFLPPEAKYNLAKARAKTWGNDGPRPVMQVASSAIPTTDEKANWRFPALAWLAHIFGTGKTWEQIVLVWMPVHVTVQPVPGSHESAREIECRTRISAIAEHVGAVILDFRLPSAITTNDENYWDSLHYRVSIASRIVADIGRALETRQDDPNGDWKFQGAPVNFNSGEPSAHQAGRKK